jgi:hypothetical protein
MPNDDTLNSAPQVDNADVHDVHLRADTDDLTKTHIQNAADYLRKHVNASSRMTNTKWQETLK